MLALGGGSCGKLLEDVEVVAPKPPKDGKYEAVKTCDCINIEEYRCCDSELRPGLT